MKKLNTYIYEAWSGVKQQSYEQDIKAWCEEMSIKKYTINSQGEIDVDGYVDLKSKSFKELPYKFGKVNGSFTLSYCKNLISLKNCPDEVRGYFGCSGCDQLDSLEGCPGYVGGAFNCIGCEREFTKEEVESLCKVKVKREIYV